MTYRVHELRLARADVCSVFDWIRQRSPQGAEAWLDAYDEMIDGLTRFVGHAVAREGRETGFKVQQVFFKTRHGNVYRALYYVEDQDVYIRAFVARDRPKSDLRNSARPNIEDSVRRSATRGKTRRAPARRHGSS